MADVELVVEVAEVVVEVGVAVFVDVAVVDPEVVEEVVVTELVDVEVAVVEVTIVLVEVEVVDVVEVGGREEPDLELELRLLEEDPEVWVPLVPERDG